ncbi:signal peptidase I [Aquibacillus sp. 3ASR75-11]|uniref:Signal peptidase I n=1 Tax=Terrihalobacillus insolitus TaxID=2950438 RepID=A0A9X3WSH8_9BACI|nr:signal peptidase I [Terrihalobacillus insolitus]MDC3413623.1 signal peptidase I [Terrihalobacillus insolitus]MDC3424620.1 signal peptidase I [Terrihalobacillus insolitus]
MKATLKHMSNLLTGLLFALLIVMAFIVISTKASSGEPSFFGYQLKTVMSGSMAPTFQTGSVIAVNLTGETTKFKKGDVITFMQSNNQLVTHRIYEVRGSGKQMQYITKGDNNENPDFNPVLSQNVVAKYSGFTIPYLGYFIEFIKSPKGTALVLFIPGVLLLLYSGFSIWSALKVLDAKANRHSAGANEQIEQK